MDFNFIKKYLKQIEKELSRRKVFLKAKSLTIAFVSTENIKQLNKKFRSKNKVTDILSFSDQEGKKSVTLPLKKSLLKMVNNIEGVSLGELVLCPSYIRKKAQKRRVSVREETAYVLLHGLLHLLGFEHEKSRKEAQKMYSLQDQVFEKVFYS